MDTIYTTQLHRQKATGLTLRRISRQSGIPLRPLTYLVQRERIHGRSGRYRPDDIFEVLLSLDLTPGPVSVRMLRDRLREHTCT